MAPETNQALDDFAKRLGTTRTFASWLRRQGHEDLAFTSDFLDPKLKNLTSPDGMADRDVAARRMAQAIRAGERIVVFGDYDCDGITSAAIMTQALTQLGGRVRTLLASRFDGGYGVSPAACARIAALEPRLLITCDCGSSDHATLVGLREHGVDIVVVDHHLVPAEPLPAIAFLNPHRPECRFPYKGLASCGLVLSIVAALRAELGVKLDVRQWLDLVAIGTIADVAPLSGDNRALVRAGLEVLRAAKRPGLRALMQLAKMSLDVPITGRDVAFRLAPHLNAPGRMAAPDLALNLLLSRDDEEALRLAEEIEQVSRERRAKQELMSVEATEDVENGGMQSAAALVVGREGWNPGIVGIVAGRLAERFERPVAVIGFEGGVGRGSVRGPKGARLHDALTRVQDCLSRFGGHQAAAGVELDASKLDEFRARFAEAVAEQRAQDAGAGPTDERETTPLPLVEGEDPLSVLADLDRLEPCGVSNPRPQLVVEGPLRSAREVKGGHLKLELELSGKVLGGFAVAMGSRATELRGRVALRGDLRHTTFPGSSGVEMFVEEIEQR